MLLGWMWLLLLTVTTAGLHRQRYTGCGSRCRRCCCCGRLMMRRKLTTGTGHTLTLALTSHSVHRALVRHLHLRVRIGCHPPGMLRWSVPIGHTLHLRHR
uniref:Putative secreted protein n=1 Tax=Anopheles darlingi TaxID=43151 RepID=A0A2M4DKK9_ANODA